MFRALPRQSIRRKTFALAGAAVFFIVVAAADANTSVELSLTLFYLGTILVVTWNCGAAWGLLFAAMSAAAQIVFGIFIGNPYSEMIYFVVDSATKIAAYLVVLVLTAQLRALYERAQNSTRFDALTHALSRAAFSEALNEKVARQTWSKSPISLAWIDCDEFKAFNEAFGHGAGDQVLCTIVDTAKLVLRRTAVIARLGGHEFGVLLPGLDGESAAEAMRTLRNRLMWAMANHGWDIRFNIGLITFLDAPGSTTEAISACRSLMQEAKRTGKDRFEQRQYSAAA